eukprot:41408_1
MSERCDLQIGICSSNIDLSGDIFYERTPVICGWDLTFGMIITSSLSFMGRVYPPRTGDTVGFLLDFKTIEYNGCVRIFKNSKEIREKPFIKNLTLSSPLLQ